MTLVVDKDATDLPPFRDGVFDLEPFVLLGVRCPAGHTTFPVRNLCASCKSAQVQSTRLSTVGVLHTFTVVRQAPAGVPVPYLLGYVELREGVRLLSRIRIPEGDEPMIGATVHVVPEVFPGGDFAPDRLGFAFSSHPDDVTIDRFGKETHHA